MAIEKKYPVQFAFVGTQTQGDLVEEASSALGVSKAAVVRYAMIKTFGMPDGLKLPKHDPEYARTLKTMIETLAKVGLSDFEAQA